MSDEPVVGLIRGLIGAMQGTDDSWGSWTFRLEFGDGFFACDGYAYSQAGVAPVAASLADFRPELDAYLASLYQPGDRLPAVILVQFDRDKGAFGVQFEDNDGDRWKTTPDNFSTIREELRPIFD